MTRLIIRYRDGKIEERISPEAIEEALKLPEAIFWLDMEAPDIKEIEGLGKTFGFHPLTLEDCIKLNQRPKLEDYETYIFVVLHFCIFNHGGEMETKELHIFLGPNYLVTVHEEPIELIKEIYDRCKKDSTIWDRGCDFIFYLTGDSIADSYFPLLDTIGEDIDKLEDAILLSPKKEDLDKIFTLKQDIVFLRKIVSPMREVFNNLSRKDSRLVSEKNNLYFRDVHSLLLMAYEMIDSYRDMVGNVLEVYLSTISNKMSEIMKRLTIIATIFMPLSFITGLFGMNFTRIPFGSPLLLVGALILTAVLPAGMLLWFYRYKWF